jgi:hypothetical protein
MDAEGRIAGTLYCRGCQYDLRGLPSSGYCPECGKPIAESLVGEFLDYADPDYVRNVHRGTKFILASFIVQGVSGFVGLALALAMMGTVFAAGYAARGTPGATTSRPPPIVLTYMKVMQGYGLASSMIFAGLSLAGWFLFTTPDPGGDPQGRSDRARRITRFAACLVPIASIAQQSLTLASPTSFATMGAAPSSPRMWVTLGLTVLAAALSIGAWIVQFFGSLTYVRWLAPRIPDERLRERATMYMWLLPLLYVVGSIACGLGPIAAIILYAVLVNSIRVQLRDIRAWQAKNLAATVSGTLPA